jgi:hypothetical protein
MSDSLLSGVAGDIYSGLARCRDVNCTLANTVGAFLSCRRVGHLSARCPHARAKRSTWTRRIRPGLRRSALHPVVDHRARSDVWVVRSPDGHPGCDRAPRSPQLDAGGAASHLRHRGTGAICHGDEKPFATVVANACDDRPNLDGDRARRLWHSASRPS